MDILLLTPPGSISSLIQYRMIGGVMDLYFYSGPSPVDVVEKHGALVGLPLWQPYWGFGLHLCRWVLVFVSIDERNIHICGRWGYNSINDTREQVQQMRAANIPLEGSLLICIHYALRCEIFFQPSGMTLSYIVPTETSQPIP